MQEDGRAAGRQEDLMRRLIVVLAVVTLAIPVIVRLRYGGGDAFPDRSGAASLAGDVLEVVSDLPYPPGNIAVSADGRVFFTFHPQAAPPLQVVEWTDGAAVPYPDAATEYHEVLSIRIDRQNRLWVLDNGGHGVATPRLLAFDLGTSKEVHRYEFPREVAGLGSHLNDFQVSPDGWTVYIADASIFAKTPAIVVYDSERRRAWRAVADHDSVDPDFYTPVVQGREMTIAGIFSIRPGVDSIALDRRGEWLYFAPVTDEYLYRIRASDLRDESLTSGERNERIERFAPKTMSDGLTMDVAGNVYITDLEHDAIIVLGPDRNMATLVRDPRLRWPDGLGFGPDGFLYVTCSALHRVIGTSSETVRAAAPYQIFRFRAGSAAEIPGH
jgi:sugar lactone lactonase YvrE